MKLTAAERETIAAGAAELDAMAFDLRMSSSIGGRGEKWDFPRDEAAYKKLKGLSARLYEVHIKVSA